MGVFGNTFGKMDGSANFHPTVYANLVVEGHSYMSVPNSMSYFIPYVLNTSSVYQSAVSGSQVSDCVTRQAVVDSKLVAQTATVKNVLALWIGLNSINNTVGSGTTTYNALKTYVQNRVAAGWNVFLWTVTPSVSGRGAQFEIERNTFNGLLRSDLALISHVYVLDTDTISEFNNTSDTVYYADGSLHLTEAGCYLANQLFKTRIGQVFGTKILKPAVSTFPVSSSTVAATGTGSGVGTYSLVAPVVTEVQLTGNARFYLDLACTKGESTTWVISPTLPANRYLKCTSGTSTLQVSQSSMTKITYTAGANAPSIGGDISQYAGLQNITITGNNTLSGSIAGLTSLNYCVLLGSPSITGDISNLTSLTNLTVGGTSTLSGSITNMNNLATLSLSSIQSNPITGTITGKPLTTITSTTGSLSGDISTLTNLTFCNITGTNTITGSIQNLASLTSATIAGSNTVSGSISGKSNMTLLSVSGNNTLSGDISGMTALQYCSILGNNTVTFSNVTNILGLCYLFIGTMNTLTSANINQLLADFWANRNQTKARPERIIYLVGSGSTGAPTGQGITDKAALQAYRSPTPPGTAALWTVTTR